MAATKTPAAGDTAVLPATAPTADLAGTAGGARPAGTAKAFCCPSCCYDMAPKDTEPGTNTKTDCHYHWCCYRAKCLMAPSGSASATSTATTATDAATTATDTATSTATTATSTATTATDAPTSTAGQECFLAQT